MIDTNEILEILPHRYPFLLVDRISDIVEGKKITGSKNVSINEPFFQGHFPGHPIMPGVLIIEAMAQVGIVLAHKSPGRQETDKKGDKRLVYFTGIDKAKFRKPVFPGDQLRLELEVLQVRPPFWKLRGMAYVQDQLVCEAELTAMFVDGKRS
jgi:3-hydroxyacyl-[acyl-carrier-protein] dehydratase/UDP-3-O-[3-hydroxymyristoyl] N-acetylglucosamine deacetylase/3-hydroxyacyl-[acyl-carrier-protein] dehydratase